MAKTVLPAEVTKPTQGTAGNVAASTKRRYVLVIMDSMNGASAILDYPKVQQVVDHLEKANIAPADLELEVLIGGPGGDAHAAYKLAKILRARASKVRFFVIDSAKSACTLLALCGDEILMGSEAELGPLDMQMEHINLEGMGSMSALEAVKPIDFFVNYATRTANHVGQMLRDRVGLSRSESYRLAFEHAERLLAPVMAKIEPSAVSQASRQLDVTRVYAERLLRDYHLKPDDKAKAPEIAQRLVWVYPDHGCVIWRDEAREVGLRVVDAEGDPLWPAIVAAYRKNGGMTGTHLSLASVEDFQKTYEAVRT